MVVIYLSYLNKSIKIVLLARAIPKNWRMSAPGTKLTVRIPLNNQNAPSPNNSEPPPPKSTTSPDHKSVDPRAERSGHAGAGYGSGYQSTRGQRC